uniref:Uncharacterized protein n=1 Tax=Oryza meridionalis TaxID=40149 RepID=A0A0E0CY30_9ORYZ
MWLATLHGFEWGIAGESPAVSLAGLTMTAVDPFLFLTVLRVKILLRLPDEAVAATTLCPSWGHHFGEAFSYKDVVGLCIGFEAFRS